jgi:hypothetical protein
MLWNRGLDRELFACSGIPYLSSTPQSPISSVNKTLPIYNSQLDAKNPALSPSAGPSQQKQHKKKLKTKRYKQAAVIADTSS